MFAIRLCHLCPALQIAYCANSGGDSLPDPVQSLARATSAAGSTTTSTLFTTAPLSVCNVSSLCRCRQGWPWASTIALGLSDRTCRNPRIRGLQRHEPARTGRARRESGMCRPGLYPSARQCGSASLRCSRITPAHACRTGHVSRGPVLGVRCRGRALCSPSWPGGGEYRHRPRQQAVRRTACFAQILSAICP